MRVWTVLGIVACGLAAPAAGAAEKKIDVGGFKLSLRCSGEGSPVVVLDSGAGDTSATWDWVVPDIKSVTRVCAYDRAGLGKSAPGPKPRSSDRIVGELHNLLRRAGVLPPYVLVGHSFGGLNVRLYAARYPDEVAGMVLVDATPEEFPEREASLLTPAEREKARTAIANAPEALRDELDAMPLSVAAVREAGAPLGLPVVVLSGGHRSDSPRFREGWKELQSRLVDTYPNATHVIAAGSGHYISFDQPDVVVRAIREVIDKLRSGS